MADTHVEDGSSSGSGHSDDKCTIKVNAYVKDDTNKLQGSRHRGCTPVMVGITGSSGLTERRNPIDVVLVLHVHLRYAAPPNWHDLVNRATRCLVEKLGANDRLAVVPALLKEAQIIFGDAVIAPIKPRLLLMSPVNKAEAREAVESSEAMRTNRPLMRDLESAESILYGRRSDEEERAGYIIVISNSNEDLSSVLSWRFRSVHAFGFHSAHNARAMHAITSRGDSTYALLEDQDDHQQIGQAFTAIIDKITSATEPVEVRLKCNEEGVLLSEICAPRICYFISNDKKVGIIWASARRPSEPTNFVILLQIPDDYDEAEYHKMLQIDAKFGHGLPPNSVAVKGRPLVPVGKGTRGSIQVAAEIVRMEALRIVTEITDEAGHRNHKLSNYKLSEWHRNLQDLINLQDLSFGAEAAQAEEVQKLFRVMQEMQERLQRNNLWLEYMMSWQTYQWWPLQPVIINGKHATSVDFGVTNNNMATTDHNSLVQTRILAKVDAIPVPMQKPQRGIPVLVHIKMPSYLEGQQRVPIDLVAVLDVRKQSGNTNEKELKLLKRVMGFLMEKLSNKDRLSIVSLHSTDTEFATGFEYMTTQGRSKCMKALSALMMVSTAAQQASQSREQPRRKTQCFPMATVSSPWIAVCGSSTLSKLLKAAVKRLDDRDDRDEKTAMGLIMIISDTDDQLVSVSHRTLSPYYAIHAFSLCSVHNARVLYRIASRSMGIYGILLSNDDSNSNSNEIPEAFRAFINNITSTVVVNTEVNIVVDHSCSAKLSTIESGHFRSRINHDKKSGVIYAGALCPGAERRFLVYVEKLRKDEYGRMSKMLAVAATCCQHDPKKDRSDEQKMVIVRGKDPGSKELVEEIIRIEELKMLDAIADHKTKMDAVLSKMQELRKRLIQAQQAAADVVGVRRRRGLADYYAMAVDEESLASLASDDDGSRLSYMLSWLSFQRLCQQPPQLVPAPTTSHRETDQNLPQPHGLP